MHWALNSWGSFLNFVHSDFMSHHCSVVKFLLLPLYHCRCLQSHAVAQYGHRTIFHQVLQFYPWGTPSGGHCKIWPCVSWKRPHHGFWFWFLKFCLTSRVLLLNLKSSCFFLLLSLGSFRNHNIFTSVHSRNSDLECLAFRLLIWWR